MILFYPCYYRIVDRSDLLFLRTLQFIFGKAKTLGSFLISVIIETNAESACLFLQLHRQRNSHTLLHNR